MTLNPFQLVELLRSLNFEVDPEEVRQVDVSRLTAVSAGCEGCFVRDDMNQAHAFHKSIALELRQRGIIFERDGHWCIKHENCDIIERTYSFMAVCDFCAARPVVWDVDCETFEDAAGNVSVAGWAACEPCGQAIADGNREWLLTRVLKKHGKWSHKLLRDNQKLFWQHYKGIKRIPARPFGH